MKAVWTDRGKSLYSRNIQITAYEYDKQRIIVEGFFQGNRCQEFVSIIGEKHPIGIVHHMSIRLLVNCSSHTIEDIDAELLSVPRPECRETINSLLPLKGLSITRGFTAKAKKTVGGAGCCTHLLELITAMAPAVVTGLAAFRGRKSTGFDPDQARMSMQYLLNTCRTWSEDGPLVTMLKKKIKSKQSPKKETAGM